jgi:predicted ATPase with chaperone activity
MISARKPSLEALRQGAVSRRLAETQAKQAALAEPDAPADATPETGEFLPKPIESIKEARLSDALIESLIFKYLLAVGHDTGRGIASAVAMPPKPIIEMLANLKQRQFVYHKDSTTMGDFEYALTDAGRERARSYVAECTYVGPAPVTLDDYIASVQAQSITLEQAGAEDLRQAFKGLLINNHMFDRLGPAINSGRGLFLYGAPGNGKTSIAERITACFGGYVWVPYAIFCSGEIITYYDPQSHEAAESGGPRILKSEQTDPRWIKIRRPTICVGGELTMESLDLQYNGYTKITEPSLQLKSNTGTFVIDDFGRQRMRPIELLNRWIVPLEKRYDYLTLANGKKIRVPFDQLIIFSTNLEPRELVDEAFLRRIPYKINVIDPTEEEFRELLEMTAPVIGVDIEPGAVDYLIQTHFVEAGRVFRCCQPRDLLLQIKNFSTYQNAPPVATEEMFDAAVENYFAVM